MIDGQLTFLRRQDDAKKIGSPIKGVSNLAGGPFSRPVPKRREKGLQTRMGVFPGAYESKILKLFIDFLKKIRFIHCASTRTRT